MTDTLKLYANVKVSKPKDAMIEIEGEVPAEFLNSHYTHALEKVKQEIEVPGFRKGKAPEKMLLDRIHTEHVLEEAAYDALNEAYPEILHDHALEPVSSPRVSITKLALGNPLGFKIQIAITPDVALPNYKKIAKAAKEKHIVPEVDEKEAEAVIQQVLSMRTTEDGKPAELTDDFVKTLGKFESVEDFKSKLKENIKNEKVIAAQRARLEAVAQQLIAESKITLPELLVEEEVYAAHGRFHKELERNKMTEKDYLEQIKKTEEEFRKEQRTAVEERLKTKFILAAIAKKEGITADEKDVETEMKFALARHPETNMEALREYLVEALTTEKVLKFLETVE